MNVIVKSSMKEAVHTFTSKIEGIKTFEHGSIIETPKVDFPDGGGSWCLVVNIRRNIGIAVMLKYLGNKECKARVFFKIPRLSVEAAQHFGTEVFATGSMSSPQTYWKTYGQSEEKFYDPLSLPLNDLDIHATVTVLHSSSTSNKSEVHALTWMDLIPTTIRDDVATIEQDAESMDTTIILQNGDKVGVHRFIVSLRSSVFRTMLKSEMHESQRNEIVIDDFPPEVVNTLINYLYTDKCEFSSVLSEKTDSLFMIAHKYDVKGLMHICEVRLAQDTDVTSVVDHLLFADNYQTTHLKLFLIEFVLMNYTAVLAAHADFFERIPSTLIQEIMRELSGMKITK